MRVALPSRAAVDAWQRASPRWDTPTRLFRVAVSITLLVAQLPLIWLDTYFKGTYYGPPRWPFQMRVAALFFAYFMWLLNPSTRPFGDVLSYAGRSNPGLLKGKKRAAVVHVPARPDKLFGDALYEDMVPENCPCFWQWSEGDMVSPVADTSPVGERKVIMYYVGGGMVQGHPCENLIPWKIAETTKIPVFGVNFRKCVTPETAFPAALQDAVAVFYYLLDEGYKAENITIAGDSGGGGIAITTLLYLNRHGLAIPGSTILISPFIDLVDDFMGDKGLLNRDLLNPEMIRMAEYQYTENRPDLRATLLSPALNDLPEGYTFRGFPKTLMAYGDTEMFAPGIIDMIKTLREAGVDVEVNRGRDLIHVYPFYTQDESETGFYGRVKRFLSGEGRNEEFIQEDLSLRSTVPM